MKPNEKANAAARFLWRAHTIRSVYENLPDELAPANTDEAYSAQEAFHEMAKAAHGPIAGLKIATTTKVMQTLMGIDHPCGGAILARRVHASPARVALVDYLNLRIECEIAVRLGADLGGEKAVTADGAMLAVSHVSPAFELIEDRHAVYKLTRAYTLIADNAWNGGVVLGEWRRFTAANGLGEIEGVVTIGGVERGRGRADGPFEALAWLANLARARGRPLREGMFVITGSLIATFDPPLGDEIEFSLGEWGSVRMSAS